MGGRGGGALIPALDVDGDDVMDYAVVRQGGLSRDRECLKGVDVSVFLEDRPDDLASFPFRSQGLEPDRVRADIPV